MTDSTLSRDAASVIAQEFKVDPPCTLAVNLPGAYVRLRPGTMDDRVEVNISLSDCPPDRAEEILDRMSVSTHQSGNQVQVFSDRPPGDAPWWRWMRERSATLYLDLLLPTQVNAQVRAPGGTIDAAGLTGNLEFESMGGDLHLHDLKGTLGLKATSTDVQVSHFEGEQIDARGAAGTFSFEDLRTNSFTLRSVAAPVQLTNVRGATDLEVQGAPLTLHELSGTCTAQTHGGSLTFVGTPSHEVTLKVIGASLETRLPSSLSARLHLIGDEVSLDSGFSFEGERTTRRIEGLLNGGGPTLHLQAVRGRALCHTQ